MPAVIPAVVSVTIVPYVFPIPLPASAIAIAVAMAVITVSFIAIMAIVAVIAAAFTPMPAVSVPARFALSVAVGKVCVAPIAGPVTAFVALVGGRGRTLSS